jgi:hypothetical protein
MHWRVESMETTAAHLWMRLWCSPGRHSTYRSEILEEGEASCKRKNCGWDDGKLILIFSQISLIKCIYFIIALIISFKRKIWDLDGVQDASEKILKDRYGEPIKILLEGDRNSNKMNTASNTRLRLTTKVGQAHVATGVPLDLGTNTPPSDSRNTAENQTSSLQTHTGQTGEHHRSDRSLLMKLSNFH